MLWLLAVCVLFIGFIVRGVCVCFYGEMDIDYMLLFFQVEEKFSELRDFLTGKPYTHHLVTPFFAVENSLDGDEEVGYLPWFASFLTLAFASLLLISQPVCYAELWRSRFPFFCDYM